MELVGMDDGHAIGVAVAEPATGVEHGAGWGGEGMSDWVAGTGVELEGVEPEGEGEAGAGPEGGSAALGGWGQCCGGAAVAGSWWGVVGSGTPKGV